MLPSNYFTATETLEAISRGDITARQVVEDHKERYLARDGELKAWVNVRHDEAMEEMQGKKGLPLYGVVVGVKDIINTKDLPTEQGSLIYKGSRPGVDASVIKMLRAAGATIIGKTMTCEFAAGTKGLPTENPFGLGHTPGGSSTGSAVAVSDYQCHIALGTQTTLKKKGASLVRPASYCGIFGYKPTWGAVCHDGIKSLVPGVDTIGILSRSVDDLQLIAPVLDIYQANCSRPATYPRPLSRCSFAFLKTDIFEQEASDDLRSIWDTAKSLLEAQGAQIIELDLPREFEGWLGPNGHFIPLCKTEGRTALLPEYLAGGGKIGEDLIPWIKERKPRQEIIRMRDDLAALRPVFDKIVKRYDGIITPSAPDTAPKGLESTGKPYFGTLFTGLHVPVVHIPGLAGVNGMPIGLSLVRARYEDEELLQVAKMVAGVCIEEGKGKLRKVPAPEGAVHIEP